MQFLKDIERIDFEEEISLLKWKEYNRKKKFVNFKSDTNKLHFVVYRYRNILYPEDIEVDLKLTDYQPLLAKWIYLLS